MVLSDSDRLAIACFLSDDTSNSASESYFSSVAVEDAAVFRRFQFCTNVILQNEL